MTIFYMRLYPLRKRCPILSEVDFLRYCKNGDLTNAKRLVNIVDIHSVCALALYIAFSYENAHITKWLYSLKNTNSYSVSDSDSYSDSDFDSDFDSDSD